MASEESTIPRIETRGSKKAADKQMLAKSDEGISHDSESVSVMPSTSAASTSTINSEMMEMLKMMAKINIQAETARLEDNRRREIREEGDGKRKRKDKRRSERRKKKDKRRSERIKMNGERRRKKGVKTRKIEGRNMNWCFSRRNCKATWRETESRQQKMCHNYLGWRMVETLKIFYGPFRIR